MHIYRCEITLMEATFFSSREVSALYQTEPLLGNYALAYALRLCESGYHNDGTIHYAEHLGALNEKSVYVTPGTLLNQPQFLLRTINAQTDAYWSMYGRGFIGARSEHGWNIKKSGRDYPVDERGQEGKSFRAANRPQHGRIRMLAVGNTAQCYVLSQDEVTLPEYMRLGKFMSKARVQSEPVSFDIAENEQQMIPFLLNPADLDPASQMLAFDMVSIPPTPLVRNAKIAGSFYRLSKTEWLPVGMRFGVGKLA